VNKVIGGVNQCIGWYWMLLVSSWEDDPRFFEAFSGVESIRSRGNFQPKSPPIQPAFLQDPCNPFDGTRCAASGFGLHVGGKQINMWQIVAVKPENKRVISRN